MDFIYLSNARLPTEKAHGYQIMKMCEAFASLGVSVELIHPFRVQTSNLFGADPFEYYGIERSFRIKQLPGLDLRSLLHDLSVRLWSRVQAVSHAFSTLLYTFRWWRRHKLIFYSRDPYSISLLLTLRPFIAGCLIYEAHVFHGGSRLLLWLFRNLDNLVVVTHELKRLYVEAGIPSAKVIVAPDGVDLMQFDIPQDQISCRLQLGLPQDRAIIGYIGRFQTMGMEKGIPGLVEAMSLLSSSVLGDSILICVGGPMDLVPLYIDLARERGLNASRIRFVDRVQHHDVPYWIKSFNVAVMPFPTNEHYSYFMSPLKLFEYMAVGAPIVASDLPSLREILHHNENAWLITPDDPQALADGIATLLHDRPLAARLAAQARRDVDKYTWELRSKNILRVVAKENL